MVEPQPSKLVVAGSSPVCRSIKHANHQVVDLVVFYYLAPHLLCLHPSLEAPKAMADVQKEGEGPEALTHIARLVLASQCSTSLSST